MKRYKIFVTDEFKKKLSKVSEPFKANITNKLNESILPQLMSEPHYGKNIKKLVGYEPSTWRYRSGKFRIFYSVDKTDNIVNLLTIERRKDAY